MYDRRITNKETRHMKKLLTILLAAAMTVIAAFGLFGCNNSETDNLKAELAALQKQLDDMSGTSATNDEVKKLNDQIDSLKDQLSYMNDTISEVSPLGLDSYKKLKYIDKNLSDRDCYSGENFKDTQNWIKENLLSAGYSESDITYQEVELSTYAEKATLEESLSAVKSYVTDGKSYTKNKRVYTEDENGTYTKVTAISENIIVTKPGDTEKTIIVGMHYDGDGTGDNGSGVALGLSTAMKFQNVQTTFTIKFIFFTAEEIGCKGSTAYANAMTEEEIANTLYMINMDSLVCGDYTYLYGGVQDNETKTVSKTEAYDNAMKVAESLGLSFKSNPWSWDNLAPENYDTPYPDYATPTTGDWSDHKGFKNVGVTYLYFEATNWEIPDYTGYGESYITGMIMNTSKDYLAYIEKYYPGRPLAHLNKFAALLNGLLVQKTFNK